MTQTASSRSGSTPGFSPGQIMFVLTLLMIVLGRFIDGISIAVLMTSVLMPVIQAAKIDPLWFGIYMVFVVEMDLVTPSVVFNLFVIQGLTKRDLPYISWAALAYFLAMRCRDPHLVLSSDRHLPARSDDGLAR
jgi:C4-dicarboxylate transporter, DctM subunit